MSSFLTELEIKPVDGERMLWELLAPFRYWVEELHYGLVIEMPKGARTDFASIPRILWNILPPWGRYGKACVIHDWLYQSGELTRKRSDEILLEAMKVLAVGNAARYAIYWGVRIGGWVAWNKHRKEDKPLFQGAMLVKNEQY